MAHQNLSGKTLINSQDKVLGVLRFLTGSLRRKPRQIWYATKYIQSHSSVFGGECWDALTLGEPWVSYSMRAWLHGVLAPYMKVFEYGSGGSTIFFGRRVASVYSIEHDEHWFKRVKSKLAELSLDSVELKYFPPDKGPGSGRALSHRPEYIGLNFERYVDAICALPDDYFDVVFIDGRCRRACISVAHKKIKNGGWLIIDDGRRREFSVCIMGLLDSGWKQKIFEGLKPAETAWGYTYVFQKVSS